MTQIVLGPCLLVAHHQRNRLMPALVKCDLQSPLQSHEQERRFWSLHLASEQGENSDQLTLSCQGHSRSWTARLGRAVSYPRKAPVQGVPRFSHSSVWPPCWTAIENLIDLSGTNGSLMA